MTKASRIIELAYQYYGKPGEGQSLSGVDQTEGLSELNSMLSEFESRGLTYTHTALAASDDMLTGAEHDRGLAAMLAERLVPYIGTEPTVSPESSSRSAWALLCAKLLTVPVADLEYTFSTKRNRTGAIYSS